MIQSSQSGDTRSSDPVVGLLLRITLGVEEAETAREAYEVVLSEICRFLSWPLGHVYICSEKDDKMISAEVWYPETLPPNLREFQEISEAVQFSLGQGTIGKVWATGEPLAIMDLQDVRQFARRLPQHDESGLRGYFAFPVRMKSEIAAVLEFFSHASEAPGEEIISVINHISALLGLCLQRQRNLRELESSEARLAEAQQTAHVGHWEWDVVQDEVSWSDELYNIFGLEPENEALTFEEYSQYLHPADLEYVLSKIESAYMRGVPFDYYHRIVRPDETVRVLHARGRPDTDHTGKIVRLHGTVQDVTEQKEAELRLGEMVRQLSAMMEISNAFTKTIDLDKLLQLIATKAHDIVPHADRITIHLLNTSADKLVMVANAGLEMAPEDFTIVAVEGIAGEVLESGRVVNVFEVQDDSQPIPIDVDNQVRALVVAPVEGSSRRIGTISMQSNSPGAFGPDDERLLTILGVQAGMAIENAQLITAQEGARARAERQRERMRAMARRVVEAQEKERERISRELHDESGQALTSLKIGLSLLQSQLPSELESAQSAINGLLDLADRTMTNLRLLSHNLRPPGLDIYGLDAALEGLCQDFRLHTQLDVTYTGNESLKIADLPALSIYRFAQEALTNIAKHADATRVLVTLNEESDIIKLIIEDNGRGFTPPDVEQDSSPGGLGLLGMYERLEMVGGRLTIESVPGQGSQLTAIVPRLNKES